MRGWSDDNGVCGKLICLWTRWSGCGKNKIVVVMVVTVCVFAGVVVVVVVVVVEGK